MRSYHLYYILDGKRVVPSNRDEWAKWMGDTWRNDKRRVARETVCKDLDVSTVFLGLNHGGDVEEPVLFETMVFRRTDNDSVSHSRRYHTWEEAERGHARIVRLVKRLALLPDWVLE